MTISFIQNRFVRRVVLVLYAPVLFVGSALCGGAAEAIRSWMQAGKAYKAAWRGK